MATKILIAYHSDEGQTEKIAGRIAETLRSHGADVTVADSIDAPEPSVFDGVLVGDSIHSGQHSKQLASYLVQNHYELGRRPLGLFQVSLTSATPDEEHATEAQRFVHDLIDETEIDPDLVGLFAGALRYTRYGWFKRHLVKAIAAREGTDTDTSRDHEYTDWDEVDHFAEDALALIESHSIAA